MTIKKYDRGQTSIRLDRIQRLMDERGMKAVDLCRKSGVSEPRISLLLSGNSRVPSIDIMVRIANALDTSIDYLAGRSDIRSPLRYEMEGAMQELVSVAQKLLPGRVHEILAIMHTFQAADRDRHKMLEQDKHLIEVMVAAADEIGERDSLLNLLLRMGWNIDDFKSAGLAGLPSTDDKGESDE